MTTKHHPRTPRRLAGAALALAALAGTATAVAPAATAHDGTHEATTYGSSVSHLSPSALSRLMQLKGTLAAYRSPEAAVAAGYLPSPECVSSPDGTMGYHYVNPTLLGSIDPASPPILVYVPSGDRLTLGAAEWFAVDRGLVPENDHAIWMRRKRCSSSPRRPSRRWRR